MLHLDECVLSRGRSKTLSLSEPIKTNLARRQRFIGSWFKFVKGFFPTFWPLPKVGRSKIYNVNAGVEFMLSSLGGVSGHWVFRHVRRWSWSLNTIFVRIQGRFHAAIRSSSAYNWALRANVPLSSTIYWLKLHYKPFRSEFRYQRYTANPVCSRAKAPRTKISHHRFELFY